MSVPAPIVNLAHLTHSARRVAALNFAFWVLLSKARSHLYLLSREWAGLALLELMGLDYGHHIFQML